ncbi:hypothetical protein QBC35DRAFT_477592 [Podospora australis]|uniref:Uncharacterized protein n=1 Tax=Podospora australis TaxID=1536484 RepID=A0AAN7AEC4_9PEZI|nr:hypothetical protein QBC35DRAFT_477592 [Podospora australis]
MPPFHCKISDACHNRQDLPMIEAHFDVGLFLKKDLHVEIKNGIMAAPNEKPSTPVVLGKGPLNGKYLKEVVADIKDLLVLEVEDSVPAPRYHSLGWDADDNVEEHSRKVFHIVLGWDAKRVSSEISWIKKEIQQAADEKKRKKEAAAAAKQAQQLQEIIERDMAWHRISDPHRQFVARQQAKPGLLGLRDLPGLYIVRSHGVKALFNFGLIEGIMLLGMTRGSIELLRGEQPKLDQYGREIASWDDEGDESPRVSMWKSREDSSDDQPTVKLQEKGLLGSIADPYGVQEAGAKRRKTTINNNEVHFQFVCRQVLGYPLADDGNDHVGTLTFDESKLSAKGYFSLPTYFGDDDPPQRFSIYKVSNQPKKLEPGADSLKSTERYQQQQQQQSSQQPSQQSFSELACWLIRCRCHSILSLSYCAARCCPPR